MHFVFSSSVCIHIHRRPNVQMVLVPTDMLSFFHLLYPSSWSFIMHGRSPTFIHSKPSSRTNCANWTMQSPLCFPQCWRSIYLEFVSKTKEVLKDASFLVWSSSWFCTAWSNSYKTVTSETALYISLQIWSPLTRKTCTPVWFQIDSSLLNILF